VPYMTDTGRTAVVVNYWYANSGTAPPASTPPFHLRLMTAMGAGNGNVSGSNGTEATGSNCPGYTALGNSMGSSPTFSTFSATSPAAIVNNSAVTWSATGTWTSIPGIEIWDNAGTPLRYMQGTVTSAITGVVNGDSVQFAASSVSANPSGD
jgi:hypothetical protein